MKNSNFLAVWRPSREIFSFYFVFIRCFQIPKINTKVSIFGSLKSLLQTKTLQEKKSHIRETPNLSTDADSSTKTKKIQRVRQSLQQKKTLYEQMFSNLRPLLPITFPQGFPKSKKFGHWTLGSGGKKTGKQSEKHQYQNIPLSKAKFAQKLIFFCAAILHPLLVKVFKSETTSFLYLPPRILVL